MNKNLKMDNSRWKELCNFKKELHKSSEHSRNKLAAQGSSSKLTENLKIRTNIDDNYEIHSSEQTSIVDNPVEDSDHQSTGTVIVYEGIEEPEGYSNPIADLGYKALTHPSENGEYMNEVAEVNEGESANIQREIEIPVHDNRGKRLSRERHTVTLGGSINYNIMDYKRAGLIDCSDENIYEDSDDESQESESQNDIQANKNIKSSNRKIFSNKPCESDEEYQKNVQVSNCDSSLMDKESIKLYEEDSPDQGDEVELTKGRNYKEALQNLYDKTSTSLTRNNIDSANKESKAKTESSMFTLNYKHDKDDPKESAYEELINKLKIENIKLKEENTRLQLSFKNQEQTHFEQISKIKDQTFRLLRDKESEFQHILDQKEEEFKIKINSLQIRLKHNESLTFHSGSDSVSDFKKSEPRDSRKKRMDDMDLTKMK